MDPFTVAFIAKQTFDLVQAFDAGNAKKKQAELTRQLAELNRSISDRNAFRFLSKGLGKANAYKAEADQVMSSQNVAYAYADVDTSFGTAQMVQEQSRLHSMLNVKELEDAAYAQALGEKQKGLQYSFQGELTAGSLEHQAKQILTSQIIKTVGDAGMKWDKLSTDKPTASNNPYDLESPQLNYWGSPNEITTDTTLGVKLTY